MSLNLPALSVTTITIYFFIDLLSEPTHERALSNLAYFDSIRSGDPEGFVDAELTLAGQTVWNLARRKLMRLYV